MRYGITALIALSVIGIAFLLWRQAGPGADMSCRSLEPAPVIVAFGDSLVEGYGASPGNDAFSRVQSAIGVPIVNLGRSGDTSAGALERIDEALSLEPDIVIVLVGGNDALRRVPVAETEAALSGILSRIKDAGARPILVGVIGGFPQDPYAPMFEQLSKQHEVPLVKNILSGLIGRDEFMSDAVHPNDAGYARMAERMQPFIERTCAVSS